MGGVGRPLRWLSGNQWPELAVPLDGEQLRHFGGVSEIVFSAVLQELLEAPTTAATLLFAALGIVELSSIGRRICEETQLISPFQPIQARAASTGRFSPGHRPSVLEYVAASARQGVLFEECIVLEH